MCIEVHVGGLLQFIDSVDEREQEKLEEGDHVAAVFGVICVVFLECGQQGLVEHVFCGAQCLGLRGMTLMDNFWRSG